jgi:CBS domain-containing protein
MGQVADILRAKGSAVFTVGAEQTVYEAVVAMVERDVGSLVVLDGEKPVGIITERDYLREIIVRGRTSRDTAVRDIMSRDVIAVGPTQSVEGCMAIMTARRIRHLPVMEGGRLVGLISIGDVVKRRASDQQVEIRYLTDYITGKYPG